MSDEPPIPLRPTGRPARQAPADPAWDDVQLDRVQHMTVGDLIDSARVFGLEIRLQKRSI